MSDSQIPDLSNMSGPSDLPTPGTRPAGSYNTEPATSPHAEEMAKRLGLPTAGPGAIPQKHVESLRDSLEQNNQQDAAIRQQEVEQHIPRDASAPVTPTSIPPEEEFRGSSFMSQEDLNKHIEERSQNQGEPMNQQTSPQQPPQQMHPQQMPPVVASTDPSTRRSIEDLFRTGTLSKRIRVSGFDLTMKTLNADEYQRAWTMASIYPEGTVREVALRRFLLAFSMTHINDTPLENMCRKTDITDAISRRDEVLSRLDNELLRRFFDHGYVPLRDDSAKLLDDIDQEVADVANFTQSNR